MLVLTHIVTYRSCFCYKLYFDCLIRVSRTVYDNLSPKEWVKLVELENGKLVCLDPSLTEWHYYDGADSPGVFRFIGREDKLYMVMLCEGFCTVMHITHGMYGRNFVINSTPSDVSDIAPTFAVLDFEWVYEGEDMPYKQMVADGFLTMSDYMKFRQPGQWMDELPKLQLKYYFRDYQIGDA